MVLNFAHLGKTGTAMVVEGDVRLQLSKWHAICSSISKGGLKNTLFTHISLALNHSANSEVSDHKSLDIPRLHSLPKRSQIVRAEGREQSQQVSNQLNAWLLHVYNYFSAFANDDDKLYT
jgi:hypothetical protein